ncbi:MAG: AAA family ATPase [Alicyclobacillus herbarius]|uniref:AAA family ATPase n=1 Tax=Alicyclobacillus herbarius TaxID=122960 RepID=UPI0023553DD2|nr:AAA family ATPase [Alicyclobacillus herbarius]MCL6633344.1 AAA family ATPase [Alicyclobacillus herbarius]
MRIKTITLENFRCYEKQTFEFGPVTTIHGHNGAGKSTLAEAVVWCLYGTNILGKSKQDESLMRLGAKDMSVAVTLVDAAGKEIVLARTRAGKKASVLTVNGRRPKPGEIEGMFGTVSEFLSVFLPGYFSSLEPKDAKAILAKCVPDVPKEEVLARMSSESAELLAHDQFAMGIDSIEVATKKVRNEIHELEQELIRAEGEMRAYTSVLEQGPPKPFKPLVSAEDRQRYEMAKRASIKFEAQVEVRESRLKELKVEHTRLQQKYREIKSNPPKVDTHCPACGQRLPGDKVQAVREKAMREYKERLAEVIQQGKQVRAELDRLEALPDRPKLEASIQALIERVETAIDEERQKQAEYAVALKSYQTAKEKLQELRTMIEQDRRNLESLQSKLKALQEFRFEYIRAQHEKLNGLFKNVRIHLMDVNKETGEIRESFRIEWKGRPYRLLSFSEKVRCDIEIGRVLSFARGEEMPVFGETFSGQVIAAFVADTQLTVKREGDSAVA